VAEAFESWLNHVIQAVEPWISSDIDKGARWSPEIADRLEKSKVGIICLTKENLSAPWILFEAGALSKTKSAYVCTFLLDIQPADVQQPLGQFQHTTLEKEDIKRLIKTINRAVQESGERPLGDGVLDDIFETFWPKLNEFLTQLSNQVVPDEPPQRADRELLQEILEFSRIQDRRLAKLEQTQQPSTYHRSETTPLTDVQSASALLSALASGKEQSKQITLADLIRPVEVPGRESKDEEKNSPDKGKKGR